MVLIPSRTLLLAIAILVASAVLWIESGNIPGPNSWQTYGSALYPRILIATMAALTFLLLIRELLSSGRTNAFREISRWVVTESRILAAMVLFGLYIAAMPWVGFIMATIAYLYATLLLLWHPMDTRRLIVSAVLAVVVAVSVSVIFETALAIRLP